MSLYTQSMGCSSSDYYSTYFKYLPWALFENNARYMIDAKQAFVEWMSDFNESLYQSYELSYYSPH